MSDFMIKIRDWAKRVIFLIFFICFINDAQSLTSLPKDSSTNAKSRFTYGAAIESYNFYKLGMKVPLYQQPSLQGNQHIKSVDVGLMIGFGHRNLNVTIRMGPYVDSDGFTTEDEYGKSDSLKLTDRRSFVHGSIELSRTWLYNKSSMTPILIEIAPSIGYGYFMRKYDGKVQDLKTNKMILAYHREMTSEGKVVGAQVTMRYFIKKRESQKGKNGFSFEENKGLLILVSIKNFANIRQVSFETGWTFVELRERAFLIENKIFFRIDEIRGALEARFYKLGVSYSFAL